MSKAKRRGELFTVAGIGAAAFAGYEFVFKPWRARQAAAALLGPTSGGGGGSFLAPGISTPTIVGGGFAPGGVQGSIVDPRVNPGGDVGQAMWRKNWPQAQAAARLSQIKAAYSTAIGTLTQLRQQSINPAAAGIPAAQLAAQQNDMAAAQAIARQQQDLAAGDVTGAALWATAAANHQNDAREIRARIAQASGPPDNSAGIAAYEGAAAALKADYRALTGLELA